MQQYMLPQYAQPQALQRYAPLHPQPQQHVPPGGSVVQPQPVLPYGLPQPHGYAHHPLYFGPVPHPFPAASTPLVRQRTPPAIQRTPLARQRPNQEPRPGGASLLACSSSQLTVVIAVFKFQVDVVGGKAKCEFSAETDISWPDFQRRIAVYLGKNTELMYKVTGDPGKASYLNDGDNFKNAMEKLCQRAYNARTRPVALEIRDMVRVLYV